MNVLFVFSSLDFPSPKTRFESFQYIHLGLSYISAVLKARGHSTHVVALSSKWSRQGAEALEGAIRQFQPQVICFTSVSSQYSFISELARGVKARWPDKFLLAGGTYISLDPEKAVAGPFDAICVGEGEYPTLELVEALAAGRVPQAIPNLWLRTPAGAVERNSTREFLSQVDDLPFPDRRMWEPWISASGRARHAILVSRGCPYSCSYCSNHALRRLASGRYVRFRSPGNVIAELAHLKREYPEARDVYLQTETIGADPDWVHEFANLASDYNRTLTEPLRFACNLRVVSACLNDRFFGALARANVRTVEIGLESGSERVRSKVLRRRYSNQEFLTAVDLARKHGMLVNTYNMVGIPTETPAEHRQTVELNRRVCPDRCYLGIYYPYPGTDLYAWCEDHGLMQRHVTNSAERSRASLDLPTFSRAQIQRAHNLFEFRVYQGQKPLHFRIRKLLARSTGSNPWLGLLNRWLLPLWQSIH